MKYDWSLCTVTHLAINGRDMIEWSKQTITGAEGVNVKFNLMKMYKCYSVKYLSITIWS